MDEFSKIRKSKINNFFQSTNVLCDNLNYINISNETVKDRPKYFHLLSLSFGERERDVALKVYCISTQGYFN